MRLAYAAVHVTHKANSALEPRATEFGALAAQIFRDNLMHEREPCTVTLTAVGFWLGTLLIHAQHGNVAKL